MTSDVLKHKHMSRGKMQISSFTPSAHCAGQLRWRRRSKSPFCQGRPHQPPEAPEAQAISFIPSPDLPSMGYKFDQQSPHILQNKIKIKLKKNLNDKITATDVHALSVNYTANT